MKNIIIVIISVALIVLVALWVVIFQPTKSETDKMLETKLRNSPSLEVNKELIVQWNGKGTQYEGLYPFEVYSWHTKYGRVYAKICGEHCSDIGTLWLDANGNLLTEC